MTLGRWCCTLVHFALACGALTYATAHVRHAGGLLILAWCFGAGFWLFVHTVDLLLGRWLRRGRAAGPAPPVVFVDARTFQTLVVQGLSGGAGHARKVTRYARTE